MTTMLEQAAILIRAGNIDEARPLLIEYLKQNPKDEDAWLWMSRCVTEVEQKRYCFEKVLKLNPQNPHAIKGLERLDKTSSPPKSQPEPQVAHPQSVKKKRHVAKDIQILLVVGASIFLVLCCLSMMWGSFGGGGNSTPTKDRSGGSTMAYMMCQEFVEKNLKSPATAKFPNKSDIQVLTIRDKKDAFQIRGYVDAQNGFGALIRTRYTCEVSYTGQDNWHLDYLEFDE